MRVAHILLKTDGEDIAKVNLRASLLRESIVSGTIEFDDAAKQHSVAPTARKGGDIGFIERDKPMHEAFSRVAFDLEQGGISRPVETPFGIHLIRCLEIEPGQRNWEDARDELTIAVTRYLFDWAADQQRATAKVDFTGASPYFEPGTEQLAE